MAALMLAGCMPHVTHGPRVEDDGLSGALSVDLYGNREVGIVAGGILPNVYGALRGSWVPPDGHGVAGSLGVQVPLLLIPFLGDDGFGGFRGLTHTGYADLYVQPGRRREPGLEWGVGALASAAIAGPYVQIGGMRPDGTGWYTTQLVAYAIDDDFGPGMLYLPTVALRTNGPDDRAAANFSAGLGFGFQPDRGTQRILMLGMTVELGRGRK